MRLEAQVHCTERTVRRQIRRGTTAHRSPLTTHLPSVVVLLVLLPTATASQSRASAYLSTEHWASPHIEHLIRSGSIADPDPLNRPLKKAAVLSVLDAADTSRINRAERETIRRIRSSLESELGNLTLRADFVAGASAGTHARRDPLREGGDGYAAPHAGLHLVATFGPVVLSSYPYFDQRLEKDPDYTGSKEESVIARFHDAYISAQFKYGEIFFGSADRNWGPPGVTGPMVSSEPYSYDHFSLRLGVPNLYIQTRHAELDPLENVDGDRISRFWATHRVVFRPWPWMVGTLGQASLWSGVGRNAEPWWLNPLKATRQVAKDEIDDVEDVNSMYSAGLLIRISPRTRLQGTFVLDDLSSLFGTSAAPDRVAAVGALDVPLGNGPTARITYKLVSSLTYRSAEGEAQTIMRRGIGLGHNYSDYTEAKALVSLIPLPLLVISPEMALLRQGEGDFRSPFPELPATNHPFLFEGVVETTWRLGLGVAGMVLGHIDARGHLGLHVISNSEHQEGVSRTAWVAGIRASYRWGGSLRLN